MAASCTAVVLAGDGASSLHPVTSASMPKALLPVANRPLITFPLRLLEEAGLEDVLVVCEGDPAAAAVRGWVSQHYLGPLKLEVVRVPEGAPTLDALRSALDRVKTDNFLLLSGDLVAEPCLRPLLLAHHAAGAAVTALLARRKVSPSSETKPGKAPRGVDYIGLGDRGRLLFYAHSPEVLRELRLPQPTVRRFDSILLRSNLVDARCYVFRTGVVQGVLAAKPEMQQLQQHLLPYLVRRQAAPPPTSAAGVSPSLSLSSLSRAHSHSLSAADGSDAQLHRTWGSSAGLDGSAGAGSSGREWFCGAYVSAEGCYCQRVDSLQHYAEINRDVALPEHAIRLLRDPPPSSRTDAYTHPSVTIGAKSTVGAGCMVGADSSLGDRCSAKRAVIGPRCRIGSNVKIINCVLMEGVTVEDNCHLQGSVVGAGCTLQQGASLRDCQVASGLTVAAGADLREEVLAATAATAL